MKSYAFDASALVDLLEDRRGAGRVQQAIEEVQSQTAHIVMCVINWGEVFYHVWRFRGPQAAEQTLHLVDHLPIELMVADRSLTIRAARFRAKYKLPYADCFAAALAQQEKARLATSDPDFKAVQREIKILWLR